MHTPAGGARVLCSAIGGNDSRCWYHAAFMLPLRIGDYVDYIGMYLCVLFFFDLLPRRQLMLLSVFIGCWVLLSLGPLVLQLLLFNGGLLQQLGAMRMDGRFGNSIWSQRGIAGLLADLVSGIDLHTYFG